VRTWGLTAMRLADAAQLPFNYTDSAKAFDEYLRLEHEFLVKYGIVGHDWSCFNLY
jgi:hypothetical protein